MKIRNEVSDHFKKLIAEGEKVLQAVGWNGNEYLSGQHPNYVDFFQFRTEAMNLIRRSCGEESDHYRELQRLAEGKNTGNNSFHMPSYLGVLNAAKNDFEAGLLFDLRSLIAAELLGDFIEQAEVLLEEGYYGPAASLAGAILEDTLRKLCKARAINVPAKTKIDSLNADLARAGVYDKLVLKRITLFAEIRNKAAHGYYEKFTHEDVDDFVKWLRRFSADYLS